MKLSFSLGLVFKTFKTLCTLSFFWTTIWFFAGELWYLRSSSKASITFFSIWAFSFTFRCLKLLFIFSILKPSVKISAYPSSKIFYCICFLPLFKICCSWKLLITSFFFYFFSISLFCKIFSFSFSLSTKIKASFFSFSDKSEY